MNRSELAEFMDDSPVLFHMAEAGSWNSIAEKGLLSTSALLDLYKIKTMRRGEIELERRPASVTLVCDGLPSAIVRDQKPMTDSDLKRCLSDNLKPKDWYRTLNSKVFFWTTKDRLNRLLRAGSYVDQEHDVLEVDTVALITDYRKAIWFCAMNSGCTKPFAHPRGLDTFARIEDYPYERWRKARPRGERIVEVAFDYSIPNIRNYVRRVSRMMAGKVLHEIWSS